jgi:hypothetical protein
MAEAEHKRNDSARIRTGSGETDRAQHLSVLAGRALDLQRSVGNKATQDILIRRLSEAKNEPLASYPPPALSEQKVRAFAFDGKNYEIPEHEWPPFCRKVNGMIAREFLPQVQKDAEQAQYLFNYFTKLNRENKVISWFAEVASGVDLPSPEYFESANKTLKAAQTALAGTDLDEGQAALKHAVEAARMARILMRDYQAGVISGGEHVATALEITAASCFVILNVAGGAALAAPAAAGGLGLTAAQAGLLASGGTAFIQSAATKIAAPAWYGDKVEGRAVAEVAMDTVVAVVTAKGSAAIMGKIGQPLANAIVKQPMMQGLIAEFGDDIVEATVRNILEGGVGNAVQSALTDIDKMVSQDPTMTMGALIQNLAINLVAGGLMGLVQGRLKVRRS